MLEQCADKIHSIQPIFRPNPHLSFALSLSVYLFHSLMKMPVSILRTDWSTFNPDACFVHLELGWEMYGSGSNKDVYFLKIHTGGYLDVHSDLIEFMIYF